ncbi:MAG: enoyl-CoA hydratase [Ramlibacter sp.]|nr:enoyl-CoA hydratase [Ramlibacter sp.]
MLRLRRLASLLDRVADHFPQDGRASSPLAFAILTHAPPTMTSSPVSLLEQDAVGVLRIRNPPVNALSPAVVQGLLDGLAAFERKPDLQALVVHCEGSTFVAGGDIASFQDPAFSAGPLNQFLGRLEAQRRPVVAALHGTVLGGGLELALACHWRIAAPNTRVGQPEVKLGLIPGSLGTQRLPRLAGAELALDLMSTGAMLDAQHALAADIVDELSDGSVLEAALVRARDLAAHPENIRRVSTLRVDTTALRPDFIQKARAHAQQQPNYPALDSIVTAVEAAIALPFGEGEQVEAREFAKCLRSPQSQAMRHLFFAERQAAKIPGLPASTPLRDIRSVGVVGAGTMGCGIAITFANAGFPVTLVEATQAALDRGLGIIRGSYEATAAKGRLTAKEVADRLALVMTSLAYDDLAGCDLVIEAVFEDMALKQDIARRLGAVCKPGAIIATNTSTLDVDQIAAATGRPADVVGMHFFSPAHVMRLLEVVRGAATAPDVLGTVMKLAARIGKVAVVSGVCYGFIGNRMAEVYMREAEFLLLEGATPAQVDGAVEALGFAMGPCRMLDMAGIDVGAKTVIELGKTGGLPNDAAYRAVVQKLFALGRFGQKTGSGYYRYEGRKPVASEETSEICEALGRELGVARRSEIPADEIVERLLFGMVNEGARILEEGIAYRAGDIDVVWTAGYGFPDHRGGPMHMANAVGLAHVVDRLDHYARVRGNAHGYWTVSPLLRSLAAEPSVLSGPSRPACAFR